MNFTRDKTGRAGGLTVFTVMLGLQFYHFPREIWSLSFIRWFLITFLFILFFSAYIIRSKAKQNASGWIEILLPLFCASLPILLIWIPQFVYKYGPLQLNNHDIWQRSIRVYTDNYVIHGLIIMAIGELITVIGMMSLKRSFSILTEVRNLVTTGIYRYIRHPLYCGEMLSVIGMMLLCPSIWMSIGGSLFLSFQAFRAKVEERKLTKEYPEYVNFKKATGFLWPKWPGFKPL